MTDLALVHGNTLVSLNRPGSRVSFNDDGGLVVISAAEDGWSYGAWWLATVQTPAPMPEGKQASSAATLVDGVPTYVLEDVPPAAIPSQVSAAQAKLALDAAGLLDDVEAVIAAHPVRAVRIWFADANVWERAHPYVSALGLEMSLDDDAIDALFVAAERF